MKTERNCSLDALRIIAAIAVAFIHSSGIGTLGIFQQGILQIYSVCMQWAVPVFLMISGALFLNPEKEIQIRTLYAKNILKLIKLFIFWSAVYGIIVMIQNVPSFSFQAVKVFIGELLTGHYHMWYIVMLIGLYAATPVIKSALRSGTQLLRYWLACCIAIVFFTAVCPHVPVFAEMLEDKADFINVGLASKYLMYYLLGAYFSQNSLTLKWRRLLYLIGVSSWMFTAAGTVALSVYSGELVTALADNALPNHVFIASALFVFVNSTFEKHTPSERTKKIIQLVSSGTLGVYLIHPIFVEYVFADKFSSFGTALIGIPLKAAAAFFLSLAVALLLKKAAKKIRFLDFLV